MRCSILLNPNGVDGLMAVNIDMEKAFDKMEWSFLLGILTKLGFHPTWINWIRLCISTSSFSVLLNGSPFGLFSPSRGLRQGDPLSPFLFIIGIEVISRLLHQRLRDFKITRSCLPLNHLLFADDLVIFTTVTFSEAIIIKGCLNKYSFWSGQTINASKSNILFSKNTAVSIISAIRNFLPYQTTPATAKHLGLPILYGNSKKAVFSDILDKVNGKIEGWRSKTLSQAGKTTLIKTMVSALPSYAMSSFLFPDGLCKQLDRAFKIFWWGFPKDKTRNLSLKSWNSLCLPNDQGGLGFRLMKEVNLSLISKLGWKMLSNHNSLWVSLFQQKYIRYGNFLSSPLPSGSWIWNGIKATLPIISAGACFIPHNHSSLPIWSTPWIPTSPSFTPKPRLASIPSNHLLAISDLIHSPTLSWKQNLLHFLFDPTTTSEILKIQICSHSDSLLWTPSTTGLFSTKSTHYLISSFSPSTPSPLPKSCWKTLWKLKLNHQLKLFLWKMV
jgi:hypothetical protein